MRIRHSNMNMLYLILIIMLAIPFAVNYQVDKLYEPIPGEEMMHQNTWPMKTGISILAILITAKMFQLFNTAIVRQPILKQNT